MPSKPLRYLGIVAACLIAASLAGSAAAWAATGPPVITQAPVTSGGGLSMSGHQLRFWAVIKVGTAGGPLTLFGSRIDNTVNTMDAYQTVGGANNLVGAFQYNYDVTHNHWHFLSLDHYEIRPHKPDTIGTTVARDQKTGFCLVDNSQANPNPTDCKKGDPAALGLTETVQPGGSDTYTFGVDGQFIDMSNVNPGTYELVEWVNADCRLEDTGPGTAAVGQSVGHTSAVTFSYTGSAVSVPSQTGANVPFWNNYFNSLSSAQKCLPTETQRPQVSGTAQVGSVLSSAPGSWLQRMVSPTQPTFTYQWRRCDGTGWGCADIPGATTANYAPTAADLGHTLRARIQAVNAPTMEQASPQDSEATAVVQAAPPGSGNDNPPDSSNPGAGGSGTSPGGTKTRASLVVTIRSPRKIAIRRLLRRGLYSRVHCTMRCRIGLKLVGTGGVPLGRDSSRLSSAGTRKLHLRLSAKGKRTLRYYRRGSITVWLHVVSSDGQQQTLGRTLRLSR